MRKQDMENQFSKKTRKKARSIQAQRIFRSRWFKSLVAMGSVVVFCTVYSLIIPAATLTEDEASADAGIVLQEAAPSEEAVVETAAETPAPEPVREEAPKEEPVVQAAAAVEKAPAAASSETVTETPAEAASTGASTEQSLNESAAAGSGSEETKTENAETANTAAANETAPTEETSGTATDETATEGTDAALTTEETTEEASTADSEESVEETTGKEEEFGTVSELKGTSGNLEAVVRFAEGAGIPENATLAIYGGSADTGKVQDALWSGSMDSIEQSTITTDLSEYVSFAVKDVDGNDITPDSDCSIEISFGSEADLSDPGENKIKKYGTLVVGSDGNVSVTGTSLSTGDGHTYATFSGKLSGNTFGFAVTTADKKVNYLEGLSGKTSDGAVEASLTFGKDAKVPEGSTLTVESASVSESSVLDKLWGNYEGVDKDTVTADDVQFVKFVIRDKDGKEISPETKVSVKLTFHHEADLSSAAEGKVKKYNALAVSSDDTITLGSKALSAENGTTTASFADISAKSALGYAVSCADKKVVYATRLTGKSEDGTIEASLRLTEEAKIPEGSLLKVTPVTGETVQKTLLDNIWTDTSIIDPDTIELTDSGLAAVTITDKDGNALKPEADATLTLTFNKEADLKEAARKMVKRAKTVAMTEENVKLSDDGLSAAEGKTKVSYTGIVDGQTFGYAVSTAKQKTNFLEGKLTYEGEDYTIEVSVNKDNQIPEGSGLKVKELDQDSEEFKKKLDQAAEAVQKDAEKKSSDDIETTIDDSSVRMFDITILNEDGDEIQPNGDVSVSVQYKKAVKVSADAKMKAIHFDEKNEEVKVLTPETKADTSDTEKKVHEVKFDTNGFSVYAIVGTEERTETVEGVADTLTETLDNITFSAKYSADARLPKDTKLVVKSVNASDYTDATAEALDGITIVGEKYFDISFEYDGKAIEPKADVEVTITLKGDDRMTKGNGVKVVHFKDGSDTPDVIDATVEGGKVAEEESSESTASAAKPNLLKRAVKALSPKKVEKVETGSNSVVTFKSDSFSVYGIVETGDTSKRKTYRTTYTFTNDDGKAYNFTLTDNPAAAENETPVNQSTNKQIVKNGGQLLEVGTPTSTKDSSKKFLGWGVVGSDKTVDTTNLITLPYTLNMGSATADAEVTLRAVYSTNVKITFYDVNNTTILTVVDAKPDSTLDLSQYEAVPASSEQGFLGWSTEKSQTSGALDSSYTVPSSDTNLYPVVANGHWLRFDKNDDDSDPTKANYVDPKFISGQLTAEDEPTDSNDISRAGYSLDGWYIDKEGTQKFSFSGTLSTETTVYAKWTPKDDTEYTVVYWLEDLETDSNGDYHYSVGKNGIETRTGTTRTYATYNNSKTYTGFSVDTSKTIAPIIKGDGTTIYNVYFKRNTYTLDFKYWSGGWFLGRWYSAYSVSNVRYGTDCTDYWNAANEATRSSYIWYTTAKGNTFYTAPPKMPASNLTIYGRSADGQSTIHYYETNTKTKVHEDLTVNNGSWSFTKEDYIDIPGFTFSSSNPRLGVTSQAPNRYIYYTRNSYVLSFITNGGTEVSSQSILYEASLANYKPSSYTEGVTKKNADGQLYVFDGWYSNEALAGKKFDFANSTMPYNNLVLYAKWVPVTYSVIFNPNEGTFSDGTSKPRTEKVNYGDTIDENELEGISRSGYSLVGWYKHSTDGDVIYDFISPITEDTTLIAHWRKTGSFGVHYVITGSTTDPLAETEASKNDTNTYADQADVIVLEAPEAIQIPTGYEFVGWSDGTTTYKPGDTFTLDASKAGTDTITVGGKDVPYVTLTAIYTKLDTTYVHYNINYTGGTGTLTDIGSNDNYQRNIPLNTAEKLSGGAGFTRVGYKLLAWNSNSAADGSDDYTSTRYHLGDTYGVDGTEGNELYAEWVPVYVEVEFTKKGGTATESSPLAGAQFTLSNGGTGTDNSKTVTSAETTGLVSFKHNGESVANAVLASGSANSLTLTENSAPAGYKVSSSSPWTVTYDPQQAELKDGKYYVTGTITGVTDNTIINEPDTKNIIIKKVAEDGTTALSGAVFKLTGGTDNTVPTNVTGIESDGKVTVDTNGAKIEGLVVGTNYTLTETKAPDGYIIKTAGTTLKVTKDGVTGGTGTVTTETSDGKTYYVITITNEAGKELPSTGGSGTLLYTIGGLAIISMATFMYVYLLRRNKQFKG